MALLYGPFPLVYEDLYIYTHTYNNTVAIIYTDPSTWSCAIRAHYGSIINYT